ncbi:MAG TPA: HAMP domain-containing sensor histidine kinase [Candidatus Saccharimonadales bacterium]|nr:HAMP domain-containing sensor histidine kinase [Candidatus Saccharimonadales bacterium]
MTLPIVTSIIAILVTGFAALMIIHVERQKSELKNLLKQKEKDIEEKNQRLAIFENVQQELDYSLNIEKTVTLLGQSLQNVLPFSTLSTLIIHDNQLVFHTKVQDKVSKRFIEQVEKSAVSSAATAVGYPLPTHIEEKIEGSLLEYTNETEEVASYFHIPVIISDQVVGVITFASTVANYYALKDMILIYQTMYKATNSVSKLREVIETEKRRLTSLITSLHDGIIMIDENDIIQVMNNSAKDILKIQRESPSMFDLMQSLSKTFPIDEKIQEAKKENKAIHQEQIIIGDKTVQIDITPVIATFSGKDDSKAPTTKVIGTSIVLHDITIESSLNKLKEDFTNEIVHELRSPLTAIKASALLIEQDKTLPEQHLKFIDIIVHQSERMLGDITSLLDAAKLETGKFSVSQKAEDVGKLVDESVTLFKTAAENKKINLVGNIGKDLPKGLIDANRIAQVVNNLISNSLKFTPENGTITVNASYHYNDHLPTTKTNPGILISVSDTGLGIPKDKQHILFSKFGQVKSDKFAPKEAGTGLGLFVSKGIVEAHGGSIFLESEEGKGTTISFTVPIAPERIMAKITSVKEILQPTTASIGVIPGVH